MNYIDLHCDTLTARDCIRSRLNELQKSGCALQVFAIFQQNGTGKQFKSYVQKWKNQLKEHGQKVLPVFCYADIVKALRQGKMACMLSVENVGFLAEVMPDFSEESAEKASAWLKGEGVCMASLCWNEPNAFAFPHGRNEGLTKSGVVLAQALEKCGVILDISHLSDAGARELLRGRKTPFIASHSNARQVCNHSRNLPDDIISAVADYGGVIGVNYYQKFAGDGELFDCLYRHICHLIRVGGEEVVALGSDMDGIPPQPKLNRPYDVPVFLEYLKARGMPSCLLEKLCYKNALRVFRESL
jgi:membrane dipeptidase